MVFWLSLPWLLGLGMDTGAEPRTPAVRCSTDWQNTPLLIESFIAHWHLFVRVFNSEQVHNMLVQYLSIIHFGTRLHWHILYSRCSFLNLEVVLMICTKCDSTYCSTGNSFLVWNHASSCSER